MKKPILLAIALILLTAVFLVYKTYNKKHTDVATSEVLQELSASELFDAFDASQQEATIKYAEHVVQLNGLLLYKDMSNTEEPQLVLEGNGDDGFIRCGFAAADKEGVSYLSDNTSIKIKGLCKGMNDAGDLDLLADRDVILSNCIIIE